MAELYPQFKKELLEGKHNLEDYGMTVKLAEPQKWLDRVKDTLHRKLGLSIMPPYEPDHVEVKAYKAIVYREPTSEPKYFDIETPLYLVKGKWKRWTPFVAMFDLADKQAKEAADTLDIELRDGFFTIK